VRGCVDTARETGHHRDLPFYQRRPNHRGNTRALCRGCAGADHGNPDVITEKVAGGERQRRGLMNLPQLRRVVDIQNAQQTPPPLMPGVNVVGGVVERSVTIDVGYEGAIVQTCP
jgi:hypothetical protein